MRTIRVVVGPLAAASATTVSLSQAIPGAFNLALDGASSTGYVANNIALSQSRGSAGTLSLNGALVQSGVAYFQGTAAARVQIVSAANDTGITFTVAGIGSDGVSSEVEVVTGANTSRVSTTKVFTQVLSVTTSGATAGNVTVGTNGTVATLDMARRILVTSAGNDSGITFTISGTDWNAQTISEVLTGANASTAATVSDFATVTGIKTSGATASTVTVGTNGVASSRPIMLDEFAMAQTSLQVTVTGTVNYTVRQTLEQPASYPSTSPTYASLAWVNHPDSAVVAATATAQSNYAYPPKLTQIVLNSGTGSVAYRVIQSGSIAFP